MWICDDHHFVPPVEIVARAAGKQMVEGVLAVLTKIKPLLRAAEGGNFKGKMQRIHGHVRI